jgi:proteasome lid subunit RPN8/RPN11
MLLKSAIESFDLSSDYSIYVDAIESDGLGCEVAKVNGQTVEVFDRSEDETDREMLDAGYIRVEPEGIHSHPDKWASKADLLSVAK